MVSFSDNATAENVERKVTEAGSQLVRVPFMLDDKGVSVKASDETVTDIVKHLNNGSSSKSGLLGFDCSKDSRLVESAAF
ncbi:MAG: hypothetical protein EOM41_08205 [Bacilli bacterium]|nr:hypothetical protein [Bacilli bacterium]